MVLFVKTAAWQEYLEKMENQQQEGLELETKKRSFFYNLILKIVSAWAMLSNLTRALFLKAFKKRDDSLKKILWEMGRSPKHVSSFYFDRFSRVNHHAKVGAAGWRVLDICYNYHEKYKFSDRNLESILTEFWSGKLENRQAVRNRLILVKQELKKAILEHAHLSEIRIVSLASGSAQAVIEVMEDLPHLPVKAALLDLDSEALASAHYQAKAKGLEKRFAFIQGPTSLLERICQDFSPHIIEMVGFMDYRPDKKAVKLIKRIHDSLDPGGFFLTCNINKNREKIFLDWVLLWPMTYRSKEKLESLLKEGGFSEIRSFYEPHEIHSIAVCRK